MLKCVNYGARQISLLRFFDRCQFGLDLHAQRNCIIIITIIIIICICRGLTKNAYFLSL